MDAERGVSGSASVVDPCEYPVGAECGDDSPCSCDRQGPDPEIGCRTVTDVPRENRDKKKKIPCAVAESGSPQPLRA